MSQSEGPDRGVTRFRIRVTPAWKGPCDDEVSLSYKPPMVTLDLEADSIGSGSRRVRGPPITEVIERVPAIALVRS